MTGYKPRDMVGAVQRALKTMPVVVLTGMRQTGKSTLLQKDTAFARRRYVSLDDFATLEAARRRPEDLLAGDTPLTIDEAQKCPELLIAVKHAVDQRRVPGHFILSGSANFALLKGVAESLAGRAVYLSLHPFTRREIHERTVAAPFLLQCFRSRNRFASMKMPSVGARDVLLGGMPSVCLHPETDISIWFRGYEQTYFQRDVRELSQIADTLGFRHLLKLAALRSAQLLKISELGRDAKLNGATTARYLNLAEASFLIRKIPPSFANQASRLIKSPKLYFSDSGLACYLAGIESIQPASDEPLRGAMMETYVAQNITGILDAWMPDARLLFWHVQGRYEVDFVIEQGRSIMAIEVKAASRWNDGDLSGLRTFMRLTPSCRWGFLAYNGAATVQVDEKCWAIPIGSLLA